MSKTPRTNRYVGKAEDYPQSIVVPASFARVLERENVELQHQLEESEDNRKAYAENNEQLRVENAALKKAFDRLEQKFAGIDKTEKAKP